MIMIFVSMDEIKVTHPKGIMHQNIWEFISVESRVLGFELWFL